MMLFFALPIKEVVPLGNCIGFIAAFCRYCINFKKMHPTRPERVVLDYEIIELSMNAIFLGSLIGVFIGQILPSLVIIIMLAITLFFMSY